MALLIPKVSPADILNAGEREVAKALVEQLPDDCIVYHSYPWLRANRDHKEGKATLREGETDFVIVHPRGGLLILEVKGGDVRSDGQKWYRKQGRRKISIKNPFNQARTNLHYLKDQLLNGFFQGSRKLPFPYGYAVVFPHSEYSGSPPPGSDKSNIFTQSDLDRLGQKVVEVLKLWKRGTAPVMLSQQQVAGIRMALTPAFQLFPVLFRQIQEEAERLHRLTEEQLRLLDFLDSHERAAIKGVAGSGKTILANVQAQRFARQGKKTLLICYNRGLADWLERGVPDEFREKIKVDTFHGLCSEWCKKADIPFAPTWNDSDEFWQNSAPELFLQALDKISDRFDAVVVDEGQDFFSDWWVCLEMLNKKCDEGPFYVFYDPAQNIFVKDGLKIPDLGKPYDLLTNCRNTRRISKVCGKIRGIDIKVNADAPEGVETVIATIPGRATQARKARKYVTEWTETGYLQHSKSPS